MELVDRFVRTHLARIGVNADPAAPLATPWPDTGGSPIFIVGCQRSGTSLVRRIIDSHPDIACPPESKFLAPLLAVLDDAASLRGLRSMGFTEDDVRTRLAAFASSFFEQYAASRGKRLWADKTPNYVDQLGSIRDTFGSSTRFVLVFRDGRDVAYSLSQRNYPAVRPFLPAAGGSLPLAAARFWADRVQRMLDLEQDHPQDCIRIHYEDLATPSEALRPVFDFLDVPWDERVIDFAAWPHDRGIEDPDIRRTTRIAPQVGKHRRWPMATQADVETACADALARLGYLAPAEVR